MVLRRDAQGLMVVGGYGAENLRVLPHLVALSTETMIISWIWGYPVFRNPMPLLDTYPSTSPKYIPKVHPQLSHHYIPSVCQQNGKQCGTPNAINHPSNKR